MEEIWKDIEEYEGLYQISNLGNVKSINYLHTGKEHLLKPYVVTKGYLCVLLCKNGKSKHYGVHRLVAEAFLPNKTNFKYVNEEDKLKYVNNLDKLQVNHKDEDKTSNIYTNLEWCSNQYNSLYGTRGRRIGRATSIAQRNDPNKSKKILQYDLNEVFVKEWPSTMEIERQLGYAHQHISGCCNGKQKQAYGFIWRYAEEDIRR